MLYIPVLEGINHDNVEELLYSHGKTLTNDELKNQHSNASRDNLEAQMQTSKHL
jgi:hypothetical protein